MKVFILALLPAVALGFPGEITNTTVSPTYEPVVFAVKAINDMFAIIPGDHSRDRKLLKIIRARTQEVTGQLLYLTLLLTGDYHCDVNVWYREWLTGDRRLIIADGPTCNSPQNDSLRAGQISDPKPLPTHGVVLNAFDSGTCHINDRINSFYAYVVGDRSRVTYTEQVTSSMTYRFYKVLMLPTYCPNKGCDDTDLPACRVNPKGPSMTCYLSVQFQPFKPRMFFLIDVKC